LHFLDDDPASVLTLAGAGSAVFDSMEAAVQDA
jgi:hypothetical protein